ARKRAEARLRSREEGIDLARAEAALKRAIVRLKVAKGE
ncbi:MAG: ATP synthase delta/epsilon chain alpha-helix domain-containing protein, partial [Armatimonadota bacterium]